MTSGDVLREARERKGYDLTTVARRLRIRPDILRAIEAGDSAAMPPRGYTRNMVNAYARLLGLNPTEIVNMYLDEAYAYQVEKARGAAPGSGFIMDSDYRRPRLNVNGSRNDAQTTRGSTTRMPRAEGFLLQTEGSDRAGSRHLYDDRTRYSRDDYGVTRDRIDRPGRSDRDFLSHHSGYASSSYASYDRSPSRRGRTRDIHVGQTPMQYSASRVPSFLQSRAALVVVAALALVAVLVIVLFVLGSGNKAPEDDVSQLPVSGITDTTGEDEDTVGENVQVEVAPTSARVVYAVERGDECYIETYTDGGAVVGELLSGPAQNTVEVTGTWTITTWSPDTIKVSVDGEAVTLASSAQYGGMYAYTVDFAAILAEWNATHNSRGSQRQAAIATASNAIVQGSAATDEEAATEGAAASSDEQLYTQGYDDDPTLSYSEDETYYYDDAYLYGDAYYADDGSYVDAGGYYEDQ